MAIIENLSAAGGWQVYLPVLAILLTYTITRVLYTRPKLIKGVPIVGVNGSKGSLQRATQRFMNHGGEMVKQGYEETDGGFFYVPGASGYRLMLPTKYMEELKNAPEEKADFAASFAELFEGNCTTVGVKWHLHPPVIRAQLNGHLGDVLPPVEDEIPLAFDNAIPFNDDWEPVAISEAFTSIIAQLSGRFVGGLHLARNPEWLKTSVDFTNDAFAAAQKLKCYPKWLRPIVQWFIPEMKLVRMHIAIARKHIKPMLRAREARIADMGEKGKPIDMLQMLIDGARDTDRQHNFLAYTALAVSFASIHPSARAPAHLILDLCANPEYITPLREEVEQMLSEEKGLYSKGGLSRLVKLDSVMKESRRFNPMVYMTFGRKIHKPFTLHDGVCIPAGTIIGVPVHAIDNDPNLYPDPERFDAWRHLPTSTTPAAFTTSNNANMHWGYGKHACSGRFFAAMEIKMVMAYLLVNYDFRCEKKGSPRPKNVSFELLSSPDANAKVLFRRRKPMA